MKNRFEMNDELKSRLLKAENAGQVADLLKEAGQKTSAEDAEWIWQELTNHKTDAELSLAELESVSGGADRDWLTDGCAATVEPNSWCESNDACWYWDVTYDHEPANINCPNCGAIMYVNWVDYYTNPSDDVYHYKCKNCGTEKSL